MKFSAAMSRDLLPELECRRGLAQSCRIAGSITSILEPRRNDGAAPSRARGELPAAVKVSDNTPPPLITRPTRAGMSICWNRRRILLSRQLELEFDAAEQPTEQQVG